MRKKMTIILLLLISGIFCSIVPLHAQKTRTVKKSKAETSKLLERRFGKAVIRIRQVRSGNYDVRGNLPDDAQVPLLAEKFFKALSILPSSFIERSKIRYVAFFENLTLNKAPAGGVASGDTIWLNTKFNAITVYHELFHTFDPFLMNQNRKWLALNHKNFVYTGSDFLSVRSTKFRRKRRENNLSTGRFDQDFVSRYAMSNDLEDRAETFAYMIGEGPRFLARTARSSVLQKKMDYIIGMTGKKRLLGKDFWDKHFRSGASNDDAPADPEI